MDWKSNLAVLQERFANPVKQPLYDSEDCDSPLSLPPPPPMIHVTASAQLQHLRPLPLLQREGAAFPTSPGPQHDYANQSASSQGPRPGALRETGAGRGSGAGRATDEDVMGHHAVAINASVVAGGLLARGGAARSSRAASEATGSMHSAVSHRVASSSGGATPRCAVAWQQSPHPWRPHAGVSPGSGGAGEADDESLLDDGQLDSSGQSPGAGSGGRPVFGQPPGALKGRWQAFKQFVGR